VHTIHVTGDKLSLSNWVIVNVDLLTISNDNVTEMRLTLCPLQNCLS